MVRLLLFVRGRPSLAASTQTAMPLHVQHTREPFQTVTSPLRRFLASTCTAVALLAAGVAGVAPTPRLEAQESDAAVRASVAEWWENASRVAPGNWGIAVADESGDVIWSLGADEPMVPASAVKLFTTGFARSVLGGDARRPTRVVGSGTVDQETGTWVGEWALELNGDVTLERGAAAGPSLAELAQQLHRQGIRRLTGPLSVRSATGDASAVWPAVWEARHRGRLFAPLVGPLTLNENVVSFTVRPTRVGQRVALVGTAPAGIHDLITVTATTYAGTRNRMVFRQRADGGWILSGRLGNRVGARTYRATARNPELVLKGVWRNALASAGIDWQERGFPLPQSEAPLAVLAEVTSPPLDSVASEVNRRSLNIGAELLLQWAAGRGPEAPAALTEHVRSVAGADAPVHLVDGSGLSGDDRVAASTFVRYLAEFPTTQAGRNFPQLLPANGSGTLRRLRAGLPEVGVVRAKTGTLNRVATIVGYLGRSDGVLVVSLMYNGTRTSAARQQQWELFRVLGADGVAIPSLADSISADEAQLGGEEAAPAGSGPRSMDVTIGF